ncbi:MAG: sulfatase-like hydrolase/transferase [Planctomycetia bacterium]
MLRRALLVLLLAGMAGLAAWLAHGRGGAGASRPHTVLLLTVDTLRQDHVAALVPALGVRTLTPRLDALALASVRFVDARTPAPLTLPAHVAMLSGRPPAVTGVRLNSYDRLPAAGARGFPLLPERLREAGWATGAFVSAQPLAAAYGLDQAFDRYDDGGLEGEAGPGSVPERAGPLTAAAALAWLRSLPPEQPAFVWVHLFEPHAPYVRYADDVSAADAAVGGLLDGLSAAGRSAGLAVLFTADHGERLGDLGERTHGYLLGDHVLRVPFTLHAPGLQPLLRDDPASLVDVAPTLAALAGVAWPAAEGPFDGQDLLAARQPASRVRVAESLYAHHLHGWAQLLCASDARGTLVDAGGSRLHWLAPAPQGEPQPPLSAVPPGVESLGDALARYRSGERADRLGAAGASTPYGGAGRVAPFLGDAENGRLPDPYRMVARVPALQQAKALLLGALEAGLPPRQLAEVERELEALAQGDESNPELCFLQGLYHRVAERTASTLGQAALALEQRTKAEQAFGKAFELGRQDAPTLVQWAGVNAPGREAEALERLRAFRARVPADCQLWLLEAQLCRALGRSAEAQEACRQARAAATSPRQAALVERTCR